MHYPPFLGGYLLSKFIHPVYRLSRTPVSDETPFAGLSPAISASQAYRQLSRPYRLFPNDLRPRLLGRNLSLVATNDLLMQLLGRNLSLVAGDLHLATSLSRDLEVAKQSSSVLPGESPPPPSSSQPGVSSPSKRVAVAPEDVPADDVPADDVPADDVPRCSCRRCSSRDDVPADDVPAYTGPYKRQSRT